MSTKTFYIYDHTPNGFDNAINHIKKYIDKTLGIDTLKEDYSVRNDHPAGDDCMVVSIDLVTDTDLITFHGNTEEVDEDSYQQRLDNPIDESKPKRKTKLSERKYNAVKDSIEIGDNSKSHSVVGENTEQTRRNVELLFSKAEARSAFRTIEESRANRNTDKLKGVTLDTDNNLQELVDSAIDKIFNMTKEEFHQELIEAGFEFDEEEGDMKNVWVKCEDRLPEDYVNVLVKIDKRIITGAYYAYMDWCPAAVTCYEGDISFSGRVTHWMEIPECLKGGDGNG